MKVCIDMTPLNNSSRFRGIGMYCVELARAITASPWSPELELFFLVGGPGPLMRIVPCEASLVQQWAEGNFGPLFVHNLYYFKHTVGWTRLSFSDMDLFHSIEPKGTSRPFGCKILVTCHDLIPALSDEYGSWLPVRARTVIEGWRFSGMDHAIAISGNTRDDFLQVSGWDRDRVSVVYHGIDTEMFNPRPGADEAARVEEVVGERPYFFYVGGYDRRKQVPLLVSAFCDRVDQLDQDLVLAGRMSPKERRKLDSLIPEETRPRVRFCGYVPADLLPALYRRATAHITPSVYEGFGMTLTEAFGCGCPVVAASASCIPEIAADAALLVPPGEAEALGDALVRLCEDESLRQELQDRGLERVKRFTWARCAADTMDVYRTLLF